MSLYAYLERGRPVADAPQLLQRAASTKGVYDWLPPPSLTQCLTMLHMPVTADPAVTEAAAASAASTWKAWSAHHAQIAVRYARYGELRVDD